MTEAEGGIRVPIAWHFPPRWIIAWQFAQTTARSERRVTVGPSFSARGRRWCTCAYPSPKTPYTAEKSNPQLGTSHRSRPSDEFAMESVILMLRSARSRLKCDNNRVRFTPSVPSSSDAGLPRRLSENSNEKISSLNFFPFNFHGTTVNRPAIT